MAVYTCFGVSLFAHIYHALYVFGLAELDKRMGLKSFVGLAFLNSTGAVLYVARIPERWFPGTFDLAGQGHNWMHVLVIAGTLVRLTGLSRVATAWQEGGSLYLACENS